MVRGLSITVLFIDREAGAGGENRSAKRLAGGGGSSVATAAAGASALDLDVFFAGAEAVFGADVLLTVFSSLRLYTSPGPRLLARGL
jgi:hypothetical protein